MRAYAVYAEVLDAGGDREKAQLMRNAVNAIRLSEKADDHYDAGLYTEAIRIYEESVAAFDDAYCVQSRLAIQLTSLGRFPDAAPHYQKAYSLMPASFGRVESHCFRCESVFEDTRARGIADTVFGDMLATEPTNPRTQYMTGYLRKEQGRYLEALGFFQTAVRFDPLYLNAWKQIAEVGTKIYIDDKQVNEAAINILELDPLRRHSEVDYSRVTDLPALWNAAAAAYERYVQPDDSVYTLRESARLLETIEPGSTGAKRITAQMNYLAQQPSDIRHPGLEIAQTVLVQSAIQAMLGERLRMID